MIRFELLLLFGCRRKHSFCTCPMPFRGWSSFGILFQGILNRNDSISQVLIVHALNGCIGGLEICV